MLSKKDFIAGIKKRAEILKKFGNYNPEPRRRKAKPLTIDDIKEIPDEEFNVPIPLEAIKDKDDDKDETETVPEV